MRNVATPCLTPLVVATHEDRKGNFHYLVNVSLRPCSCRSISSGGGTSHRASNNWESITCSVNTTAVVGKRSLGNFLQQIIMREDQPAPSSSAQTGRLSQETRAHSYHQRETHRGREPAAARGATLGSDFRRHSTDSKTEEQLLCGRIL